MLGRDDRFSKDVEARIESSRRSQERFSAAIIGAILGALGNIAYTEVTGKVLLGHVTAALAGGAVLLCLRLLTQLFRR